MLTTSAFRRLGSKNITWVDIPQLARINNGRTRVRFHKLAARQFQCLWAAWEEAA